MASIDDSKSFWSKLKSLTSKTNQAKITNTCISKQEWLNHFENLFSSDSLDNSDIIEDIEIEEPNDEIEHLIFNESISDDESICRKALIKG